MQIGSFKLVHSINISEYQLALRELQQTIIHKLNPGNPILPFLHYELSQTQLALNKLKLKEKNKRSIDFLGTIWKWIAGSPDHQDLRIINGNLDELSDNNNKQIIINRNVFEAINNLTERANIILKNVRDSELIQNALAISVKEKLKILKEELINIEHAINWSKVGILNSFILSEKEVKMLEEKIESNNVEYINIEEALEFAETKIASSIEKIIFIVSLPITNKETCESKLIKPVKKNNVVFKIKYNEILKCNETIVAITKKCKTFNDLKICYKNDVLDITNSKCLPNLLKGRKSYCPTTSGFHIPEIESVIPGLVMLNEFNGTIQVNEEQINLTGTYLIQYRNTSLKIADQEYSFTETVQFKPLPAIIRAPSINSYEEILSLEMIKDLEIRNRNKIANVDLSSKINLTFNTGIIVILIILIILLLVRLRKNKLRHNLVLNSKEKEITMLGTNPMPTGTSALEKGGVNTININNSTEAVFLN